MSETLSIDLHGGLGLGQFAVVIIKILHNLHCIEVK